MTEHTYSRAKPTSQELDKLRSRLGGTVQPNASGATADILPGSTASLAARMKQPDMSEEQERAAEHNRRNREQFRLSVLAAQRAKAAKEAKAAETVPEDPVNGQVDPLDDDSVHDAATTNEPAQPLGDELLD